MPNLLIVNGQLLRHNINGRLTTDVACCGCLGACCVSYDDGSGGQGPVECTLFPASICASLGGTWYGIGSICATTVCQTGSGSGSGNNLNIPGGGFGMEF